MEKDLKYGDLLGYYGQLLTDTQRNVMEMYYFYDNSLGEIAECLGVTRQCVRGTLLKAQRTLDEHEEKIKFADKAGRLAAGLLAIGECADELLKPKIDALIDILEE